MTAHIGCGDNSCVFKALRASGGMGTNGGCRCFKDLEMRFVGAHGEDFNNRDDVRRVQQDTQRLAGELHRVRATNAELLAALDGLLSAAVGHVFCFSGACYKCPACVARAAVAKTKGGKP